ncbi:MAG: nicotinamide riboside transporter PnuC [Chitinophagales bacterium]
MTEFLQQAYNTLLSYSWIDWGALISGILYVTLAAKENVWCWLFGLVNVGLFFVIAFNAQMYSDVGLQVIYFGLTIYGWWKWVYGSKNKLQNALKITTTSVKLWSILIFFTLFSTTIFYFLLSNFTNTDVAFWDALTTALSLTATWMTARKKLENWLVWIIADPIYVGLLYYKGWHLSSLLFGIYTVIAVFGYFEWKRKMQHLD